MDVTPIISTPPESAGRKFYLAYLNSSSWRITRNRALSLVGYKCERCGSKRDVQVHHKSYERLGREWDQDLECLCDTCHGTHHEIDKAQKGINPKIYLKIVGSVMHGRNVQTFSDLAEAVKAECAKAKIPYDAERVGHAIGLVSGRLDFNAAPVSSHSVFLSSSDPLNKGEALRIMFELMKDEKQTPLRVMPKVEKTPGEQLAHEDNIHAQVKRVQAEQYRKERGRDRQPFEERLEAIFGGRA